MMAGVLSCFVALFLYQTWHTPPMALGIWVLFFLTLGLFAPTRLERVYQAWMKFAEVIRNFNLKLILGLLYFVMFTPVRMVAWLFREDPLTRKIEPGKKVIGMTVSLGAKTRKVLKRSFEPLGFVCIFEFKGYF